jgi:DNA-binding MarR family transcriptional regulator
MGFVATVAIVSVAMANIPLDPYVLDVLMADLVGHDRKPSAFLVYLHLAARAQRARRDIVSASLQDIATHTGLSKSSVQAAIRHLRRRHLVADAPNADPREPRRRVLRPWQRLAMS